MALLHSLVRRYWRGALVVAIGTGFAAACARPPAVLTRLVEARRLASELHVQFTRAADAANRAVMADTDEASAAAAAEARRARQSVERDVETLGATLASLGYKEDAKYLEAFKARFEEYGRLDDEILPLAVENTNLKAQRLSFGPSREAADAFRAALDAAVRAGARGGACCSRAIAARAETAMLEIQVTYAPHIAESDDAAMTRMEDRMNGSAAAARTALSELRTSLSPAAAPHLAAASAALDRFASTHSEIIRLSRRNSEVRSLALSLGRKRTVAANCEAELQALADALAKHAFTATR